MTLVGISLFARSFVHGGRVVRSLGRRLIGSLAALALILGFAPAAFAQTATVTATWDANTDGRTAGYVVYYGTASGSYAWSYDAGNQTSAQLSLNRGATYYFAVRGYDSSAQLGPASTEASFTLPGDTAPTASISASLQSPGNALVTWSTGNAASVTINGVGVAASGSTTVPISGTTTFTLIATSAAGLTTTRSATVTVSGPTATITATLQSPGNARVTWSTTNATSARINGATVALSGAQTVPISGTTTFTLVATGANGQTATRSATVTVTSAPPPAPTASVTAVMQSATRALVTWQTTNASRVTLDGGPVVLNGSVTDTVNGTATFTVVATNSAGVSVTKTATVSATSGAPGAPSGMVASVSNSRVTLSWRAPTGPAVTNYLVDVGISGSTQQIVSGAAVGNVLRVAADFPRGSYWTRVRAANGAGVSGYSNLATFSVGRRLVSPQGFKVRWIGSTAVLTWTAPSGDGSVEDIPTNFVLEAGTGAGLSDIGTVNLGNVTQFSAPIPAGTYYVRLRATNDYGDSDPTPDLVLTVGVSGGLQAPTAFQVSRQGGNAVLTWNAPAGPVATAYIIEVGTAPGVMNIGAFEVGNVTQFVAPAPPGPFYVRVRARNGSGTSAPSNEAVLY